MKLGLIARADNSGLGVQTWEFYRHMKPDKTLVVDISSLNGNKIYRERYPDGTFTTGFPNRGDIIEFLKDLDVVFVAEAPYNYELYSIAKEMGVKTAVQYNYEFFDWAAYPHYPTPDMLIAPSRWHFEDVQKFCDERGIKHVYLHCPVDRQRLPFRKIKQAKTFVHNAGRSASHDRNGTQIVIDASKHLWQSDIKIKIHFQGAQGLAHQTTHDIAYYAERLRTHGNPDIVDIECFEHENYWGAYTEGDVMLLPRRYGGNCLPLNEALSVGMPVIMPDISPNDFFLPKMWLLPAERVGEFTPRTKIDIYGIDPIALGAEIDQLADMSELDFELHNSLANQFAEQISWDSMKWRYMKCLEDLCTQS